MLKAKLDSVRRNKKGFSLVELIIVIAIMVALIAVMAPAFVKYVQKSRDAALATAAEDLEKTIQTFYGDPDCEFTAAASSVKVEVTDKKLALTPTGFEETNEWAEILKASGADTAKAMGVSKNVYTITISVDSAKNVSVTMGEPTTKA